MSAQPPADSSNSEPKTTTTDAPAPLTLEALTLPESFDKTDPLAGEFLTVLNEAGLASPEVANKLVALQEKVFESQVNQWLATNKEWMEAVEKDPVYGGDKLDENLGKVSTLINEFAAKNGGDKVGQDVREAMDLTGAGNHPAIVKFLIWTCSQLSEGRPLSGGSAGTEVSRAQKLFGSST